MLKNTGEKGGKETQSSLISRAGGARRMNLTKLQAEILPGPTCKSCALRGSVPEPKNCDAVPLTTRDQELTQLMTHWDRVELSINKRITHV